jgi:hypothetical protein
MLHGRKHAAAGACMVGGGVICRLYTSGYTYVTLVYISTQAQRTLTYKELHASNLIGPATVGLSTRLAAAAHRLGITNGHSEAEPIIARQLLGGELGRIERALLRAAVAG